MGVFSIIALAVFFLICMVGIALILVGAPGTWVIFAAALAYDLIPGLANITNNTLALLFIIALLGEAAEYYLGAKSAKKYGASNWGAAGAVIGGITGAIIGVPVLIVGSLLGLFIGAFLGAFVAELFVKKNAGKAFKAGVGAFRGRVGAMLVKLLIGILMIVITVRAVV
jgi:uncharacterized protein YqgC (DUF456 family)